MRLFQRLIALTMVFLLLTSQSALAYSTGPAVVVDDTEGWGFSYSGPTDWDSDPWSAYGGMNILWGGDDRGGWPYGPYRHWSYIQRYGSSYANYYINGTWRPNLPYTARYHVYAYIPWNTTTHADYRIGAANGLYTSAHRQFGSNGVLSPRNEWVHLGTYPFNAGTSGYVSLDNWSGETDWYIYDYLLWYYNQWNARCQVWDAVQFVPINGEIVGNVFHDRNMNGVRDGGEEGLANRPVRVDGGAVRYTDSAGNYRYPDVTSGNHLVQIDLGSNEFATRQTSQNLWVYSEQSPRADFGVASYGKVTGAKFFDENGDGVRQSSETTQLSGWEMKLTPQKSGLRARYYDNYGKGGSPGFPSREVFSRIDQTVDFDWWLNAPCAAVNSDDFAVKWDGMVYAPVDGSYTFTGGTDDGLRLSVDGVSLVDRWIERGYSEDSASIQLKGGTWYPIHMEMYENGGAAVARLKWRRPGSSTTEVIPTQFLSAEQRTMTITSNDPSKVGTFEFTSVIPGESYTLTETLLPDETGDKRWRQTYPASGSYGFTVPEGANTSGEGPGVSHATVGPFLFGNWQEPHLFDISGKKFDDSNADGLWDGPGEGREGALSGWRISLLDASGRLVATNGLGQVIANPAVTAADGSYSFPDLPAGDYRVVEEDRDDWRHRTSASVDVALGGFDRNVDFGNVQCADVTVEKFHDRDHDGRRQADVEEALPGWTMRLKCPDGSVLTSVTGGNGQVRFDGLLPGDYEISEVVQPGWSETTTDPIRISVPENGSLLERFGNIELASIRGVKFHDRNADGVRQEATEEPLEGWRIRLHGTDITGLPEDTSTVTGADGTYAFAGLKPGQYWVDEELDESGWQKTAPIDTDAPIQLSPGETEQVDFGNVRLGSIQGVKFEDMDGDGVKDPEDAEHQLEGWEIRLQGTAVDGRSVDVTTSTDASGTFEFPRLLEGDYTVTEVQRDGYVQTTPPFERHLDEGDTATADIGNFKRGTIDGIKWHDTDGDGVREDGEPLLSDWTIRLTGPDGTVETKTDLLGRYRFEQVGPGTHRLSEVDQDGWLRTSPFSPEREVGLRSGEGSTGLDFGNVRLISLSGSKYHDRDASGDRSAEESGVAEWEITLDKWTGDEWSTECTTVTGPDGGYRFTGQMPGRYRVREAQRDGWKQTDAPDELIVLGGEEPGGLDFGNVKLVSLSGSKYHDRDADGVRSAEETALAGWRIALERFADGTWSALGEAATDDEGRYAFDGLMPGRYRLVEEQRDGWKQTAAPDEVSVLGGDERRTLDFGNVRLVRLQGSKYDDSDASGSRSADETGVAGWKMTLERLAGTEWSPVGVTETTGDGGYAFDGLMPGRYRVVEEQRDRWKQTDAPDEVGVLGGDAVAGLDFGNVRLGSIRGLKWDDSNGDGVRQSSETTRPVWVFELDGTDVTGAVVEATATTDAQGEAAFPGLLPGTYTIAEHAVDLRLASDGSVIEPGWKATTPVERTVELAEGEDAAPEFGNIHLGWVRGRVTHEVWGYGVPDISIILEETGETVTTDKDGYFWFYKVLPNGTSLCPTPDYLLGMDLTGTKWKTHDAVDKSVVVDEGSFDTADFTVYDEGISDGNTPRTIGYWKTWSNRYSRSEMEALVALVNSGSGEFSTLTVDSVSSILQPNKRSTMEEKARMQFLATWLNIASGNLGLDTGVNVSGIRGWRSVIESADENGMTTVWALVKEIEARFDVGGWLNETWETIKNVLDGVNNGSAT